MIPTDYIRATHSTVLQDANHNFVGIGGEN